MKFTTTKNYSYRNGIGMIPKPWIDYSLDWQESIERYLEKNIKLYDADCAGDVRCDFVFEDGKAFRLYYSWYLNAAGETDSYGEELPWVIDEHEIEEIKLENADVLETKSGRDWI